MRCPHCGTRNARETRLCVKCAQPLSSEAGAASPFSSGPVADSSRATQPIASNAIASNPISSNPMTNTAITNTAIANTAIASGSMASNPIASSSEAAKSASSTGTAPVASGVASGAISPDAAYKPSGQMGNSAPLLCVAALVGGPLVGVIYHYVSRWMNLLLVSQLFAGFLVGAAIYAAVRIGKCRNPRAALSAGVVGALLCFATFLTLNSQRYRPVLVMQQLMSQSASFSPQSIAKAEQTMTVPRTLVAFLEDNARYGVTLRSSHSGSSSSSTGGTTIKGAWYWGLLALEIGIVVLTASALGQSSASARFCERCDVWWQDKAVHKVHFSGTEEMVAQAQARDWNALRAVTTPKKPTDKQYCTAQLQRCPKCSDATMKILSNNGGAIKTVFQSRLEPQEAQLLAASK